jgi:carbon-monoxide dehydrogenase medium subunit
MGPFEYLEPRSVKEACRLLSQYEGKAALIAGGTDLLVFVKEGTLSPDCLIDIGAISGLNHIRPTRNAVKIGALATLDHIASSSLIREKMPILFQTAQRMANPGIRNMATIGGNLCTAAPSADMAPPLIGLGATLKAVGSRGEREIPVKDFFVGPGENALDDGEMLVEILVPVPPLSAGGVYMKMTARTEMGIALVGVAVGLRLEEGGEAVEDARVVMGAVGPTPMRARNAERLIEGSSPDDQLLERVARTAAEESKPISDVRGSAGYRREMVRVLTKRALKKTLKIIAQKKEVR